MPYFTAKYDIPYLRKTKNSFPRKVRNNRGEVFNTIVEAAKQYGIRPQYLSNCVRKISKTAGKYPDTKEKITWYYVDIV